MHEHFGRELLISAAVIIGGIAVISLALYFLSSDLSSQAEKIVADRSLIIRRSQAIDALVDLKKNMARAQVYKQAMDKLLVSRDQLLEFRGWLDGLSRARQVATNLTFDGSEVLPQGDAPGYSNFTLDLRGSLDGLIDFVKDVEIRAPRFLVNLPSFDLSRDGSSYRTISRGSVYFR